MSPTVAADFHQYDIRSGGFTDESDPPLIFIGDMRETWIVAAQVIAAPFTADDPAYTWPAVTLQTLFRRISMNRS